MKQEWRYYKLIAHIAHNIEDLQGNRRLNNDWCRKPHTSRGILDVTYLHVLESRHAVKSKWRKRIARAVSGASIVQGFSKHEFLDDLLANAEEDGFILVHREDRPTHELICLTAKGRLLQKFPFGTTLGIIEHKLAAYPRSLAVIFSAFMGAGVTALITILLKSSDK